MDDSDYELADELDDKLDEDQDEDQDIEGYMEDVAVGVAVGEDVVELLEDLEIATETWALYSIDEGDYDELKDSVEQLIRSEPNSVYKLLAATYMKKW
ncbi:hypothetical protein MMC27_001805 [Xylographa pallens]|nr:hypothetical protein [Xylographa pallens]